MLSLYLLLLVFLWQPIYLVVRAAIHLVFRDTWDAESYWVALKEWFTKLVSLVFSKPVVS